MENEYKRVAILDMIANRKRLKRRSTLLMVFFIFALISSLVYLGMWLSYASTAEEYADVPRSRAAFPVYRQADFNHFRASSPNTHFVQARVTSLLECFSIDTTQTYDDEDGVQQTRTIRTAIALARTADDELCILTCEGKTDTDADDLIAAYLPNVATRLRYGRWGLPATEATVYGAIIGSRLTYDADELFPPRGVSDDFFACKPAGMTNASYFRQFSQTPVLDLDAMARYERAMDAPSMIPMWRIITLSALSVAAVLFFLWLLGRRRIRSLEDEIIRSHSML